MAQLNGGWTDSMRCRLWQPLYMQSMYDPGASTALTSYLGLIERREEKQENRKNPQSQKENSNSVHMGQLEFET